MSDRTRLPRPDVVRHDPAAAWAEVEKMHSSRIGAEGRNCGSCFHAYEYAVQTGGPKALICHEGPPQTQVIQVGANMAIQSVARTTGAQFFCHRWKTRD
jgi:hypothetical protein